jgi:hypothetical protein
MDPTMTPEFSETTKLVLEILSLVLSVVGSVFSAVRLALAKIRLTLDNILVQVHATNGRVLKLETKADAHDRQDDERHSDVRADIAELRRSFGGPRADS